MLRKQIRKDIAKAISNSKFQIPNLEIEVTRTADPRFGDFASNVAFRATQNAKRLKTNDKKSYQSPMEIAKILADSLKDLPYLKKLEVVNPGFINFWIHDKIWQDQVKEILKEGDKFGSNNLGRGKKARVEFVSANPTGPLHFGNARGGPIGDSLAFILEFCGYRVLREYLHNDVGVQVQKLGESIVNAATGGKLEDQEYKGEYIRDLAEEIFAGPVSRFPPASARSGRKSKRGRLDQSDLRAVGIPSTTATRKNTAEEAGKRAVEILLKEILADCKAMGIKFDKVYPESEFAATSVTKKVLRELEAKGVLKKQEGAVWFAPSDDFLKDRETVVVKSDGAYTYFANDIAYHRLKFQEGYDLVIDILGANHHGHVPRLKAAVAALGYDPDHFHVVLYQWVRFKRGEEIVKMAKRAGTFVTVREILDEAGPDAVRFFLLMHDANSHIDFDLDLAKQKSKENPVYYVQYAHARISSILRRANSKSQIPNFKQTINYRLLTTNYELDLIKQITRLPELVEEIGQSFAVHRLTSYAIGLADSFHKFYENCQVIGVGNNLESPRLSLILATKTALANTLKLLGVSAPEKM